MKIEYRRVNHLTFAVPAGEHEKARAFYGGILGLKEVKRPESLGRVYDLIWYEWLDILLHIDLHATVEPPTESRHIAIEVKDIHAVRAHLKEKGA